MVSYRDSQPASLERSSLTHTAHCSVFRTEVKDGKITARAGGIERIDLYVCVCVCEMR